MAKEKDTPLCLSPNERGFIKPCPAVYKITNPLGEVYVGGSKNVFKRYGQYSGDSFKGQPKLSNSFHTFGKENHKFAILEYCEEKNLHSRERFWSLKYDVINKGLNCDITGDGNDKLIRSKEVLIKIGLGHKGKKQHPNNRAALTKAVKGKKQSPEHIEKRKMCGERNPMYGKEGYWKGKHIPPHVREALLNVDRSYEKNGRAKKVINIITGEIIPCAKRALPEGMKYSTFKRQLQGKSPNKTNFRYL